MTTIVVKTDTGVYEYPEPYDVHFTGAYLTLRYLDNDNPILHTFPLELWYRRDEPTTLS